MIPLLHLLLRLQLPSLQALTLHITYVAQSSPTASPKTSSSSQVRRVAFEPLWEDSSSVFVDELPG